ncbi:MAG: zinc ABC transporter substrate-binding protein [Gemmataceae bacterium]|nr:zinc ABC transporter substrate-binding protein [Gemmataceae bacterium]
MLHLLNVSSVMQVAHNIAAPTALPVALPGSQTKATIDLVIQSKPGGVPMSGGKAECNRPRNLTWFVGTAAVSAAAIMFGFMGCSAPPEVWPETSGKRIMTSFAPIYCFVANVAGDDDAVLCLLTTTGPHDAHPTPRDAIKLQRADLFFTNGIELDTELSRKLAANAGNKRLELVDLGQCPSLKDKLRKVDPNSDGCCGNHHGGVDPHTWLGIPEAIAMVGCIRDKLKEVNPSHAAGYEQRAADYIARLQKLQADGMALLAGKKDRNIVTFHDSLRYFASSFDLNVVASIQPQAGTEPDPRRLARLVDVCKKDHVRVLAVEPQYPRNTAATSLLEEIRRKGVADALFVEVDPIETAPPDQLKPDYYEKRMRENVENLAKALQ